jgi:septum site-determining protein MinC
LSLKKKPSAVEIKGFGSDINVILSNEAPFSDIERELIRKLEKSRRYLAGTEIVLDAQERILDEEECVKLDMILNTVFDLKISFVRADSDETKKSAEMVGWEIEQEIQKVEDEEMAKDDENSVVIVKNTIRSGQEESYPGSVVIIGDVNPGGGIEAGGDIIVFGTLRGVAHAGAYGNTSATITAIELRPLQLRIAGIFARSPDSNSEPESVPEVARIKDDVIVIESLDKFRRGD